MYKILSAAFALAATYSGPASQFDLVCKGSQESTFGAGKSVEPYETTYHIDLAKQSYCEGECKTLSQLAKVGPSELWLVDQQGDRTTDTPFHSIRLDRTNGAYTEFYNRPWRLGYIKRSAQCEKREFSGFPQPKLKF